MKNLKLNFVALAMLVFGVFVFTGCSESDVTEESVIKKENGFESLRLSFLNPIVVFEYASVEDIDKKLDEALPILLEDLKEEINKKNYSDVIAGLKFHNGRVIVSELVYFRDGNLVLEDSRYFNEEVGEYVPLSNGMEFIYNEIANGAACPHGYTNLGKCSNIGNTEECLGGLISGYLTKSLTSVGDCANVQVSVGLLNTTVCGKTC